ncbi:MAG: M23 family metallopeptidase [Actinomycetota bacterium]|nr:M23 family metallopeptidase [Actinomycetota bacterium]
MRVSTRLSLGMPAVVAVLAGTVALVTTPDSTDAGPQSAAEPQLPAYHLVAGEQIAVERWLTPVYSYRLTGRFGDVSGYWSASHTGLDFAAGVGTPIRSIASGVVVSTAYDGSYGNKTVIRLHDGTHVWYCHQDASTVVPGEQVNRGQVIGTVGLTGNVTGPHLHLEIRPGGADPVDPEMSLRRHRVEP